MCRDLDIDPKFFDGYRFSKDNETYRTRSKMLQTINIAIRERLPRGPAYDFLRRAYRRVNTSTSRVQMTSEELRVIGQLRDEFSESNRILARRFDLDLRCWQRDAI